MIAVVAQKNAAKLDSWLARIGRKNPERAMDLYLRMIEYHIPKLSRQEIIKPEGNQRVIDSSQLTPEQRDQLRQMILAQAETVSSPPALEHQAPNVLEPVGLGAGQVIESVEE